MAAAATEYAEKVHEGEILAGRAVRLACDRHLEDLRRVGWDPMFPYWFDEDAAHHACEFYPMFLSLENGDPFKLIDWQEFTTGNLFGWKRDGLPVRRFRTAYIETGKGSGKTPWLGGLGLFGLVADQEHAAEIFSAATQRDQAGIMLRHAIRMASESDDLSDILNIGKYNIAYEDTHSFFRAVSSEQRGLDGHRPHFALIDELQEHRDAIVVDKMRAGFKRRPQPLEVDITNSGSNQHSVCWEHHQRSIDVLEGVVDDDAWFCYVCHLDPCDDCFKKGYRQPRDGCSECDDWTDVSVALKTNPSLDVTPGVEYLRAQIKLGIGILSKQALVKRLNFCIWTQSHQVWIAPDDWNACAVKKVSDSNPNRNPCAAGLDLSAKLDLTACVVAVRVDDNRDQPVDKVIIEGTDDYGEDTVTRLTLNYKVDLIPFFWLPKDTLIERVKTERIPYDVWEKSGDLLTTLGGAIDYDVIYQTIVGDLLKRFRITALGYDPREATQLAVQMRDRGRVNLVELSQGRPLSEALKLLEVLIKTRRLRHDGNAVLGWCFANAEPKHDRFENLWIEKSGGNKRIDGAVAAAMAIHQLMLIPQKRRRRIRASVVTARGGMRLVEKKRGKETGKK